VNLFIFSAYVSRADPPPPPFQYQEPPAPPAFLAQIRRRVSKMATGGAKSVDKKSEICQWISRVISYSSQYDANRWVFYLFFLLNLRLIAKQVISTYIYHSSLMTSHSGSYFNKVWEEREARPILVCWELSKEASVWDRTHDLSLTGRSNHWATAVVIISL